MRRASGSCRTYFPDSLKVSEATPIFLPKKVEEEEIEDDQHELMEED
jgi:hypothetical protein